MDSTVEYIRDEQGRPVKVVLPIETYRALLDELEELESVAAFDAATAAQETAVPFEDAVARIEGAKAPELLIHTTASRSSG